MGNYDLQLGRVGISCILMVAKNSDHIDAAGVHLKPLKSIEDLRNEVCRALYVHWKNERGSGRFDTLTLVNSPEVIPYVVILDIVDAAPTFRFRMCGQAIVEAFGQDLTGKLLDKTGQVAPLTLKLCGSVAETNTPFYSDDSYATVLDGKTMRFNECVALPLLDSEDKLAEILLLHGPEVHG